MKLPVLIIYVLFAIAFIQCSGPSSQNAASSDSVAAVSDTVSQPTSSVAERSIDFFLDSLRAYTNEEALVAAFGRENVKHQEHNVVLFPGTKWEVVFDNYNGGDFTMFTAGASTEWKLKNGLRIGMTITEVVELNKSGFAFQKEGGYSGSAGGALESGFEGWGFEVPKEVKENQKYKEWITFDELDVNDRDKVKIGFIILYYEDQSAGG